MTDTSPKVTYIFEALDKSGITITDFARLTSISRKSLYAWKKGSSISDRLRLDFAYSYALRIEKACRLGELPLQDKLRKEQRVQTLRKIISGMATK